MSEQNKENKVAYPVFYGKAVLTGVEPSPLQAAALDAKNDELVAFYTRPQGHRQSAEEQEIE